MSPLNTPIVWLLLLAIGSCMVWIVSDYRAWKSLGKGGVPYKFRGWLMLTRFRPAKRDPFGTDIYNDRIGVHPVPHRQLDQFAEENIRQQLEHLFGSFIAANHRHVRFAKSFYEKRNDAVTLIDPGHSHALAKISHGEAAHIHPADGSMHMIFSPSDAKQIIEKEWGERHPLAGVPNFDLPDTYLMIYAPRDPQELAVIAQLLLAAVQHLCMCNSTSIN